MEQICNQHQKECSRGDYTIIEDAEDSLLGLYDKPLPFFGCGIGWFSFLLGFVLPLMWYYATILYFRNYYQRDPRERTGLATCAIASLVFSVGVLILAAVILI
ncbi:hypothetical protein RND81_05G246300 [Saponaria officinalis]|uniref:60S ribosomal protein L18a-like protein n=1 Tax=Saponaria officinalis TaxID=3572 RepID=A0AAW1L211_SAPOF